MDRALLVILTALVLCLLGLAVLQERRRGKQRAQLDALTEQADATTDLVRATAAAVTPSHLDLSRHFIDDTVTAATPDDLLIYPTGQDTEILVFGSKAQATQLGTIIQRLPDALARAAVGADAAIKLALAAGEQGGMLVRLTQESTKQFRELSKLRDTTGAVMGVLLKDGKFAHMIRFTPAAGLQVMGGVAGALQGIALQAQLASIEKAIGEVATKVDAVQQGLDMDREADFRATRAVVMEVYRASQATGALTPAMWQQIAPLAHSVRRAQERARLELESVADKLEELAGQRMKVRRTELEKLEQGDLQRAFDMLQRADRVVAQFQALRLWHVLESSDPGFAAYRDELTSELEEQRALLLRVIHATETAAREAGEHSTLRAILSPFDARKVEGSARDLLRKIDAVRALSLPPPPALPAEPRNVRISSPLPAEKIRD